MEKIIFFGLVIPILAFVLYLGVTAIMKGMNSMQLNSYFEDRNFKYNIMMQIQREVNCHVKTLASKKEYIKLSGPEKDKLADKELDKFNKLSDKKQEDVLLNMEKDAEKIFKKRNLFNEIGH